MCAQYLEHLLFFACKHFRRGGGGGEVEIILPIHLHTHGLPPSKSLLVVALQSLYLYNQERNVWSVLEEGVDSVNCSNILVITIMNGQRVNRNHQNTV